MMVAFDVIARHLRASGFEVTLRPQRHRRRRQDHPQGEGREADRRRGRARLHREDERGPARARRARRRHRAARDRAHRRGHRHHRAARGEGPRLRGGRRRLLLGRRASPRYGQLSGQHIDDLQGRRAHRGRRAEEEPARLRALEGRPSRASRLGEPLGPRAARLAHRVLGDGAPLPGRAVRHPRRRRRPRSSRTTRTRSPSPRGRSATASSPATGSTPGW